MSSILKAIRKIEDDKRPGANNAPDLMVDRGQKVDKPMLVPPLLCGLVLGVVITGCLFWALRFSDDNAASDESPVSPAVVSDNVQHLDKSQSPETITTPADVGKRVEIEAVKGKGRVEDVILPRESAPVAIPVQQARIPVETLPEQSLPQSERVLEKNPAAAKLPVGVELVVSEIFHQEESVNSMAVVNDLPVMVGTHVGSAIVTAIHPDRVVFTLDGKSYDVSPVNP